MRKRVHMSVQILNSFTFVPQPRFNGDPLLIKRERCLERGAGCPRWVKTESASADAQCPLYFGEQTSAGRALRSASCHVQTHAPQQNVVIRLSWSRLSEQNLRVD